MAVFFLCALTAGAQTLEWRYTNSTITTFAQQPGNPDVVFAGDAAGLIRKSPDKGASWHIVSFQSEAAIRDIAFINATTGFAATAQPGLILVTTDGGMNWSRKYLVDAAQPENLYRFSIARIIAVDENTAFFDIFNHPISAPTEKEALVTRDGGATFRIESAPGEVYHVSGSTMLAFGRELGDFGLSKFTVHKSMDKGMSWNIVKISPDGMNNNFNNHGINMAVILSAEEFFITANKELASDKNVYKTTDGGLSFTPLSGFPKAKADYLYFKNASEGFAITGNANGYTTFTTSDGGTTWVSSSPNIDGKGCYLGNDTFIAYDEDHTTLSTDFGKTWVQQSDPINTSQNTSGAPSIHFLQVINDSTSVASVGKLSSGVYSGRELVLTTNKGLTWKKVKDGSGKVFTGENFYFASKDTFFFTGTGYNASGQGGYMKIRYTTDGGQTFADLHTGTYHEDVREIIFIDNNNAVTYSLNSLTVNYSTDGGMTWTPVNMTNIGGQIETMQFPAMDSWYAMTNNRKIFRSTNRGQSWNNITGSIDCGTMSFFSATTGFVHGCRGELYQTTDGGQNWNDISSGLSSTLQNNRFAVMSFLDNPTGYMSDPNTNVIYPIAQTTDGGNTWNPYSKSQIASFVVKIDALNENTAAMLDRYGNFAIYTGSTTYTTDTVKATSTIVSVAEPLQQQAIALYPNPATDAFTVEVPEHLVQRVEVLDITGRTLVRFNNTSRSSVCTISTKTLATGIYTVVVHTADGVFSQRLHIAR